MQKGYSAMTRSVDDHPMWIVARLGAYMHYAVPRILYRAGRLERFYTDFYLGSRARRLLSSIPTKYRTAALNRLSGRFASDLPCEHVWSFPWLGLEYYLRQEASRDNETRDRVFLWAGKKLGKLVTQNGFGKAAAVYGFNTAALEIFRAAKLQGLFTVLEQTIAPRAIEEKLIAEEHKHFPDWERTRAHGVYAAETIKREHAEWQLADLIVCGSEFVRQGVVDCGGANHKCVVVPYGVDTSFYHAARSSRAGPLRVLCVGQAGLRKGVSYAAETARLLGDAAKIKWIGTISLLPKARRLVEPYVNLTGPTPRNIMAAEFQWADVLFLPSVCEGSATVTYEALMSGLPVITTPNAGSVVIDGVDGFIVAARDSNAMAERLRYLHMNRDVLSKMQDAARSRVTAVSLEGYESRLMDVLTRITLRKPDSPLVC
jgi:glycosyltransferase involved in cell wall biosynthesis